MKSLAAWCVRHRIAVLVIWLLALVGMTLISQTVGSAYKNTFDFPTLSRPTAYNILKAANPQLSGDVERVVFAVPGGQAVTDPVTRPASRRC